MQGNLGDNASAAFPLLAAPQQDAAVHPDELQMMRPFARFSGGGLSRGIAWAATVTAVVLPSFAHAKTANRHAGPLPAPAAQPSPTPLPPLPPLPTAPIAPGVPDVPALTTAAAIRALSPEQAEQALPVLVRGVITCAGSLTFIQDGTAGIFIDVPVSTKGKYQVGQFGDLSGYTAPGLFAPQIVPRKFTVLGTTALPLARPAKYDELSSGKLDSQRVEIAGIIRAVMSDERPDMRRTVTLKMASDDGVFPVTVSDLPPEKLRQMADASVRARGVVGGVFNERRQMIGIKVYVGTPDDLIIDVPGAAEPYTMPVTPIERLLRFQPEGPSRHRVRIQGTVTLARAGAQLFIDDGSGGVLVRIRQMDPVAVGDRLDVLGFPEMGDWTPFLNDAVFRRQGPATLAVIPISVTADQELSAGAHDSRLVTVEGELVDVIFDAGRFLMVAKSKNVLFEAELPRASEQSAPAGRLADMRNGSRVRLTGISVVRLDGPHDHPTQFRLLLRSPDDVTILQKPSWWTLGRLIWILIGLATVAAAAVVWGVLLRRRVRVQTGIIRKQIQNETTLEARYQELFDNANDIVYTHDVSGRILTVNRAGETITGYSRAELMQKTIFDLALPRKDAIATWLQKLSDGQVMRPTFESELVAKDGRFIPVEISVRALMDGDRIKAIEGIARDISERKRAENELGVAHKRLVEASRRAGMAEVATGVLHNVGNVLTSVTASATQLTEQLRGSSLPQLTTVAAAVRAHAADLPQFIANDPAGRALPDQLAGLAEHLTGEHRAIAREVESLGRSVEHIKEIVAMQQGYARVSGVREEVAAETLIEDAVRINREALERHRITLLREFAPAPPLLIEKHKVLEILVNLLSNAKYACDDRPGGTSARITVRIDTPKGERAGDRVRIVVADNGIGIAHEHLARIFDHGFTTRRDGNGLGLHSASTTARELGGSLFVHSDGVGKGARFTLDLPVRPAAAAVAPSAPAPGSVHDTRRT
jgi:PAS domain S-box-containing protein